MTIDDVDLTSIRDGNHLREASGKWTESKRKPQDLNDLKSVLCAITPERSCNLTLPVKRNKNMVHKNALRPNTQASLVELPPTPQAWRLHGDPAAEPFRPRNSDVAHPCVLFLLVFDLRGSKFVLNLCVVKLCLILFTYLFCAPNLVC